MVMKLYGAGTPNVLRAIQPLFETEVDVEKELVLVKVDLMSRQQMQPIFAAKQPFQQVPYFEDGDVTLFESRAIARYLAEKYEGQGVSLLGKTLKEKATINQWLEVEGQNFMPAVGPMLKEIFVANFIEKRPINEELMATCMAKANKVLDVYEVQLSKNKYLAGDSFSLADTFHSPYLNRLKVVKPELFADRKHVSAWVEDVTTRPAFVKCLQLDWESASKLQ